MVRALLAAAAAALVALSVPVLRAEWVYGAARGYGSAAYEDLPGRLEGYAEAARLRPSEPVFVLRRGQILLARARRDPSILPDALRELSSAVRLQPLDPRARSELSDALLRSGDPDAARSASEVSVLLGPRHPSVLAHAVELRLRLWRGGRSSPDLRAALGAAQSCERLGESHAGQMLARTVARSGPFAAADLLEATEGDPALRAFAAGLFRAASPDLARVLETPAEDSR